MFIRQWYNNAETASLFPFIELGISMFVLHLKRLLSTGCGIFFRWRSKYCFIMHWCCTRSFNTAVVCVAEQQMFEYFTLPHSFFVCIRNTWNRAASEWLPKGWQVPDWCDDINLGIEQDSRGLNEVLRTAACFKHSNNRSHVLCYRGHWERRKRGVGFLTLKEATEEFSTTGERAELFWSSPTAGVQVQKGCAGICTDLCSCWQLLRGRRIDNKE